MGRERFFKKLTLGTDFPEDNDLEACLLNQEYGEFQRGSDGHARLEVSRATSVAKPGNAVRDCRTLIFRSLCKIAKHWASDPKRNESPESPARLATEITQRVIHRASLVAGVHRRRLVLSI
ncbi:MAG: hypothetical protein JWM11_6505 [Planctomycetaceae bacterium]|nr:hypothetical protein [Planctomycetaceae bacterium]